MLGLIIIWAGAALSAPHLRDRAARQRRGATLAYFLGLSLIHVPGVLPFLGSDSGLAGLDETQIGFDMTLLGIAAFVAGAVLARRNRWAKQRRKERAAAPASEKPLDAWAGRALELGIVAQFVIVPLSDRIPSTTSIASSLATLLIIGLWLVLYSAAVAADRRRTLATLALLPLLPLATLVMGGFVGYGVYWVCECGCVSLRDQPAAHLVLCRCPAWWCSWAFHCSSPIWAQRTDFREFFSAEEQAGLLDRLDRASSMITKFELLDLSSPTQVRRARWPAQSKLAGRHGCYLS